MGESTVNDHCLVTGANGFVGSVLVNVLQKQIIRRALRRTVSPALPGDIVVGDIGPKTDWKPALQGVDCVIHLAARTHVIDERSADPLDAYRHINVLGTQRLAEQAAAAGVRRFVFLSSIKVNGETTAPLHPFTEEDSPQPQDAYGTTKREAEDALREISARTSMEVVVLRPPLVYGPGVKGNFLRLLRLIDRGMPLPLASVNNLRSLVYVGNLVDAIVKCVDSPAAAGKTYLVSDGEDLSTPDLIRKLASAMGRTPRLLPCPPSLLHLGATLLGKRAEVLRLTGSLTMDSTRIRSELGWQPPFSVAQGLEETGRWYLKRCLEAVIR